MQAVADEIELQGDIVSIPQRDASELFVPKGLDPIIAKLRSEADSFVPDISTEAGRKKIASFSYKIARSKTAIDTLGKNLVAGIKEQAKIIDAERARAWREIEELQKEVRRPLTEWEERDKRRIAEHETAIAEIKNMLMLPFSPDIADIESRLARLAELSVRDFEEFTARAVAARAEVQSVLSAKIEAMKREAAEREELARLRKAEQERQQREREERLQSEAAQRERLRAEQEAARVKAEADAAIEAERLRREAEAAAAKEAIEEAQRRARQAEAYRIAAEEKAKRDAEAAIEKAKRDAEEAIKRERDRAAAAKKAEADAAAKREANAKHRNRIHAAAIAAILEAINGLTDHEQIAAKVVDAICCGSIPAVEISY